MRDFAAEEHAARALALLAAGNAQTALKEAETALAADPDSSFAHMAHAVILAALDRHTEALDAYARCAVDMAEDPNWHTGRITSLSKAGRHKEAIAAAEEALRIAPRDAIIWYRKGAALARAAQRTGRDRQMKKAKQALHRSLELDPNGYVPRIDLGWIYLAEGRTRTSERLAREAMDLKPGDPRIHLLAAEVAFKSGRWDEAEAHIEALASLLPGQAETMRLLLRLRRARASALLRAWERGSVLLLRFRLPVLAMAIVVTFVAVRMGVTKQQAYIGIGVLVIAVVAWLAYTELQVKQSLRKPVLSKDF